LFFVGSESATTVNARTQQICAIWSNKKQFMVQLCQCCIASSAGTVAMASGILCCSEELRSAAPPRSIVSLQATATVLLHLCWMLHPFTSGQSSSGRRLHARMEDHKTNKLHRCFRDNNNKPKTTTQSILASLS